LFAFDILVLTSSLIYINIPHAMYTLIASFVFSRVVDALQNGGYAVRGMFIISKEHERIAKHIMELLNRGVTYLDGKGGYSGDKREIVYVVMSPREVKEVKNVIAEIDPHAFVSVINVHEAIGEGFTYMRPKRNFLSHTLKLKEEN
jgi:uncharacterized membrane-anchored protein YitT (DUF2179 family)